MGQALSLVFACAGVWLATVNDLQFNWLGTLVATASVGSGLAQKVLCSHLQKHGGLSSLQLMHASFPAMTVIGFVTVPLMDIGATLPQAEAGQVLAFIVVSALVAFGLNYSTTLVLGVTSPLA